MKRIHKILVANRGEIACRIMRTARAMGIRTVAVYSEADKTALHVQAADEAVCIGPAPSSQSYLLSGALISAAQRTGADAIHPGYGFLSERVELALACEAAGIIFIGPPAEAIRAMGSKARAKQIARSAGVPVVPGYDGEDQSEATLIAEAETIGFPVLIKASAGGGGKGMKIARDRSGLPALLASARREAQGAFGDGTLLLERYVDEPRHVEIQILGDQQGNVVHLFERECSIQRRHQKIIEETPSTALSPEIRQAMGAASLRLAKSIGYFSAGTVEFILAPDGSFFFLEVNTRLQVEHPVTECVTGLDLVREQIRIARGEPLSVRAEDLRQNGAAIECRLYAEDPRTGFLPSTGTLELFRVPNLPGLRVDAGVAEGHAVSVHYDPLLAKVITEAPTRAEAIQRMILALEELVVAGVRTNRAFLVRVLEHEAFFAGQTHTHFIEQHFGGSLEPTAPLAELETAAIFATVAGALERAAERTLLPALVPGFRNNRLQDESVLQVIDGDVEIQLAYRFRSHQSLELSVGGQVRRAEVLDHTADRLRLEIDGRVETRVVALRGARAWVSGRGGRCFAIDLAPRFPEKAAAHQVGEAVAPMPGKIVLVPVKVGDTVRRGDTLVVLEAMKMEHPVRAPEDGVVESLAAAVGAQVEAEAVLAVVKPAVP
ncbi:MAG: acetyl-CoA carboxylase biotin carboxylase subunit [Myxococcota bacterium]